MAISLNNHESRIKALETGGSSSWSRGENANGYWFKNNETNMIIQFGKIPEFGYEGATYVQIERKLPISFSTTNYTLVTSDWCTKQAIFMARPANNSEISCWMSAGKCFEAGYLAIGYLISDRILKYAYACKSLLFTPLRKLEV